jgi:hypothetical protein
MWLEDADIRELLVTWNFLVGHNELPKGGASIPIYFTCGGSWFEAWKDCEFADCWLKERDVLGKGHWEDPAERRVAARAGPTNGLYQT